MLFGCVFIVGTIRFFDYLPPFLPLIPRFIEVVVVTVFIEVLRVIIVLSKTVATARASVGAAATVVEGLGRLWFLLLLLGLVGGDLCFEFFAFCNYIRQIIPQIRDLSCKLAIIIRRDRLKHGQRLLIGSSVELLRQ